jgi:1-phosphofructokinase
MRRVIVTLTPNPSLDRTLHIGRLTRGQLIRADDSSTVPSGKGVNVSRDVAANGLATTAVLPVGGHDGQRLAAELTAQKLTVRPVPIAGDVRSNITLLEPDGTATKVNEPGPRLSADELDRLLQAAVETVTAAADASWLVGSGSLPPAAPTDCYARLVAATHVAGSNTRARVAIDCTGAALLAAVAAGADLVKPNTAELAEATGCALSTRSDVVAAARQLTSLGAEAVLASLGVDGAMLITSTEIWHAAAPSIRLHSAIGAGDALLAGFVAGCVGGGSTVDAAGDGRPGRQQALERAVAYATRRCELPAAQPPRVAASDLARVSARMLVDPADLDVALAEPVASPAQP